MTGDDLQNDVAGIQHVGGRGVLVRTGKFRQEELDSSSVHPDAIVDSIADLPDLLL
jgi:phospholysine phosphohistidine inorganic pyrophosphate phosphatase